MTTEDEGLLQTLGGRVKWARKQRGLSQAALGKAAGVSQGTIGNIEAGIREKPRELVAIAHALRASAGWLDTGKGEWSVQQTAAAPNVFEDLSEDEKILLDNFRHMLDHDREELTAEIAKRASRAKEDIDKYIKRFGLTPRPARADLRAAADKAKAEAAPTSQRELPLKPPSKV